MGAFMPCYYKLPEYVESTPRSAASDKEAMNVNRAAYNMEKKTKKKEAGAAGTGDPSCDRP